MLVAQEKTCKDTTGVTITSNEPFTNIVDCASACKAKLQNTMFTFENKKGCKESKTGCQCHCIESVTDECTTIDKTGLTLYKFKTEQINLIHGPIGIKLGGRSAPEIALSIIAQLVSETYKK